MIGFSMWPMWYLGLVAFVLGTMIGSFLNVCISRWPAELSVVSPRSRCPRCERPITWYENIPLVSYVLLRGKCRGCQLPISLQYPAIELLVGLGWVAAVLSFPDLWTALCVAIFGTILLGIAVTDGQHYVIPDGFTVFGLIWVMTSSILSAVWLREPGPHLFVTPGDAVLGACVGAGVISIIGWLGEVALKKEAMGFGDVTLMAVVGAAVGSTRALLTVFVGAAIGAIVFPIVVLPGAYLKSRREGTEFTVPLVPFGVFLAPAAMVTLLWGDRLIAWYMARLGL